MSYFNICRRCGAHLDPGERCDCEERVELPAWISAEQTERAKMLPAGRPGKALRYPAEVPA